jgi:hypothetical protein
VGFFLMLLNVRFLYEIIVNNQVVDAAGNPLCLQCHSSFNTALVGKSTLEDNPWLTRLCSRQCMQQFWVSLTALILYAATRH